MQLDSKAPNGPLSEKWDKHLFDLKLACICRHDKNHTH